MVGAESAPTAGASSVQRAHAEPPAQPLRVGDARERPVFLEREAASIVRSSSSSCRRNSAWRCGGSDCIRFSSIERIRRTIWTLPAPQWRISVQRQVDVVFPVRRAKDQPQLPAASRSSSLRKSRRPTRRSRRCSWSIAITAVVGSLIAADKGLDRDIDQDAKGEGRVLLHGALAAERDRGAQRRSSIATAPPYSRNSGSSTARKSPTLRNELDDPVGARGPSATSPREVDRQDDARSAFVQNDPGRDPGRPPRSAGRGRVVGVG